MKIDLTKEEWELLHFIIPTSIKIDYFDEEENLIILGQFMEKLGSEWVDDESNATLPCGYEEGLEPSFTYD